MTTKEFRLENTVSSMEKRIEVSHSADQLLSVNILLFFLKVYPLLWPVGIGIILLREFKHLKISTS